MKKTIAPQSQDVTRHIEQLVDALKKLFLQGGLQKTPYDEGQIQERKRDIFYDTDGIQERQNEKIRCCSHCAGAFSISSTASTGQHIMGVHIPLEACPACRKTGMDWFQAGKKGNFRYVYLQDRDREIYDVA